MKAPAEWLEELTEASVVKVLGGRGGTGFFVAPETVITCAHVVASGRLVTATEVTVVDKEGRHLTGTVQAEPRIMGPGKLWAYPDLCVITLAGQSPDHSVVMLGETPDGSDVSLIGFTDVYAPMTIGTRRGHAAGVESPTGRRTRRITDCEMPEGLSGSPVVDLTHGVVCGVAKTRRLGSTEMGGLAIPAAAIETEFPLIWALNQQFGDPRGQWKALRNALRVGVDPRHYGLTGPEWEALISAAERLSYQRRKLTQLWRDIMGPLPALPTEPINQVTDLIYDLSGRPFQDGLEPLIKLFEAFADRFDDPFASSLRQHADNLATRNAQATALDHCRSQLVRHERPVIVIRLEPSLGREEVNLTAWAYDYWDGPQRQVSLAHEYGPHPVTGVKETILKLLNRELAGEPTVIQLALPDHMLDEAVETWEFDGYAVGIEHPVVVRFAEWPGENGEDDRKKAARRAQDKMRSWRGRFKSLKMPATSSTQWTAHWVDCANTRSASGLYGMLKSSGEPPFIAMSAWRDGDAVPTPIDVARSAGAPVIIWRHKPCMVRDPSVCSATHGGCPASLFRKEVIENLSGVSFDELPERIQNLRAVNANIDDSELGLGVAILWDEPDHVPWADPRPSQAPAPAFQIASEVEQQR